MTCFVAEMKNCSDTGDEKEEDGEEEENFYDYLDELMNCACYQGEET